MILSLLICLSSSQDYPLIIGVKKGEKLGRITESTNAIGRNHVLFIIEDYEHQPISSLVQLRSFGNVKEHTETIGYNKEYKFNSETFNFLEYIKEKFDNRYMIYNPAKECTCKLDKYDGGLLIVRVKDGIPQDIDNTITSIDFEFTISFLARNNRLFDLDVSS